MERGRVFNVQRFSVHDGPGIRTTVFLKGCPLRCRWCHNPEGISPAPEMMILANRCIHCGRCVEVCPSGLATEAGLAEVEGRQCTVCGTCAETCPAAARQLAGRSMTAGEVLAEVLRDRIFYDDSGGGVTFSGGEPLMQPRFLRAALAACREEGVHTAVDTCGFCRRGELLATAPLADLFLFDLKVMDEERHRQLTGVSNRPILQNLEALARAHDRIWIRIPVIAGLNDDRDNMAATARFVAALPGVRRVSLLPYHSTGEPKRQRLPRAGEPPAPSPDLTAPDPERLAALAGELAAAGLESSIGGFTP